MWCWRRTEKISWIDHVRNEEVLLRVKEQRNILHEISKRTANWIGHILRRNCLRQRAIEGKIEGGIEETGRRGRRRRKLLDDFKERRGYSQLKEEAVNRTGWRARFGRGFGPVVRQTTEWMNIRGKESDLVYCFEARPGYRWFYTTIDTRIIQVWIKYASDKDQYSDDLNFIPGKRKRKFRFMHGLPQRLKA